VLLILLIIPLVALLIDRLLYWVQAELFPYRYGGPGLLHRGVRAVLHAGEDLRLAVHDRLTGRHRPGPGSARGPDVS
jgi:hypothetical protein